jgi:EAL domain-containing protein (putative c-di-GMP-specific phosphodiesterase class I)
VRAIVDIGAALHLRVVAEGIEREEQIATLTSFGCEHGQGYLFSQPLAAADAGRLLTTSRTPWAAMTDHHRPRPTARIAAAAASAS